MPDLTNPTLGATSATGADWSPDAPSGGVEVVPTTTQEVLALTRDPQWVADRDAILVMAALRDLPAPPLYSTSGYSMTGLTLWHPSQSGAMPPEGMRYLFNYWHRDSEDYWRAREQAEPVSVECWQIVLYTIVVDYLLPAMRATHYRLDFTPNRRGDSAVRATVPRPHRSDSVLYTAIACAPWPEVFARTVATNRLIDRAASHRPDHG